MGGNQSKISQSQLANEKIIIERLQALQTKESYFVDSDYVCIGSNGKQRRYAATATGLSITTIKHWEHELLEDPKNRLVGVCPILQVNQLTSG
jgi:bleomycin hydrolase